MLAPGPTPKLNLKGPFGKNGGQGLSLKGQVWFPTGFIKPTIFQVNPQTEPQTNAQGAIWIIMLVGA